MRGADRRHPRLRRLAWRAAIAGALVVGIVGVSNARLPPEPSVPVLKLPADLDAMIGQMLVIGFNGTRTADASVRRTLTELEQERIGGVIIMDRNVRSPRQVRELTAAFLATAPSALPLIAIDQEGGAVQRLSSRKGFGRYPTARLLARRHQPADAYRVYWQMASELAAAGVNLNLGPVVDLDTNANNPIIGRRGRSFGADPERVTAFARAFIAAHHKAGVMTSLKHFPGHGSSRVDSHRRFVDLSHSWSEKELAPYEELSAEGRIDTVMVGHLYHPAFSDDRQPATLAPRAIRWLRDSLGFDGVVITDDLGMGAIRRHHSLEESLVQAVAAGNDVLLLSQGGDTANFAARATAVIHDAVANGRIPLRRIKDSYRRILALKATLRDRAVGIDAALRAAGSH